jgi:hypothetical protein
MCVRQFEWPAEVGLRQLLAAAENLAKRDPVTPAQINDAIAQMRRRHPSKGIDSLKKQAAVKLGISKRRLNQILNESEK